MTRTHFATTPVPPYFAVIFSSLRSAGDNGYGEMADKMVELATRQPGFLGAESARGADGFGITVSYWESLEAIDTWRNHLDHQHAQGIGLEKWYEHFELRVARVDHAKSKPKA